MKLLIFENEFVYYLDSTFKYVNELHFGGKLEYDVFSSSQEFKSFDRIHDYDIIIIDISLSRKSELDGFGLLKKLNEYNFDKSKVIIMTGNHQIKESLKERGNDYNYEILTKPIDVSDLKSILKKVNAKTRL